MNTYESLKATFDNLKNKEDFCIPGSECNGEGTQSLIDYPTYTDALYALLVAPVNSGIYISRIDMKEIALNAGESMSIHPRKRMFEMLMKYAVSKETMQLTLDAIEAHMENKIAIYEELGESFLASKYIFDGYIAKANKTIASFPSIIKEYF
jgi:hypothetical protein